MIDAEGDPRPSVPVDLEKSPGQRFSETSSGGRNRPDPGSPRRLGQRYVQLAERSRCRFCREKVKRVDYKDVQTLQGLCRGQGRIIARQRSGNCSRHQHMVKRAVKRARFMALLSYTAGPAKGRS